MSELNGVEDGSESLGAFLRATRERQGSALDDAVRVTRIGKNYLVAIEGDQFDKIPSPVYVRGFLRIYAGYLGLSADAVVACYDRLQHPAPRPSSQVARDTEPAQAVRARRSGGGRWLVPAVLLALVLAAAYFYQDQAPKRPASPAKTPPPQVKASPVVPVQPPRSSSSTQAVPTVSPAAPAGPVQPQPQPASGGVVLKLKANQDCRLNITIDGVISQQYDLKAGDLIEWKGEHGFTIDLENAGGVEAEFNGKPLKPFGEPGKSAHVVLRGDAPQG